MNVTQRVEARIRIHRALPEPPQRLALRKLSGLTQQEIADAVGVTRTAVAHWESGRRTPNGKTLAAYLDAIGALQDAADRIAA